MVNYRPPEKRLFMIKLYATTYQPPIKSIVTRQVMRVVS